MRYELNIQSTNYIKLWCNISSKKSDPWAPPQTNDIKISRGEVHARVFCKATSVLCCIATIENYSLKY